MVGICAVLGGCGAAAPAPQTAAPSRAEVREIDRDTAEKPSSGGVSGAAQVPAAPAASPSDSPKAEPAAPAFPDLAESPGALELEPGAELVRKEQWVAAQVRLNKLFPVFDTSGPVDAVLAAHVLYGRSCAKMKDTSCADREHNRAISLWNAPGTAAALQGDTSPAGRERLTRALSAIGEALYYVAEQKRAELNKIYAPVYKGESTREGVTQFVQIKVADWVKQKTALVEETETAYAKIFDLKPSPLPRWSVAAAARSAVSWGRFAAELRAAPIPEEWKSEKKIAGSELTGAELRKFYYESLDRAAEPLKTRARTAFERCRDTSDQTQHRDEYSRTCVSWLEKTAAISR